MQYICLTPQFIHLANTIFISLSFKQQITSVTDCLVMSRVTTINCIFLFPLYPFLFLSDLSFLFVGSIKGRRSSYLLAITTERSKSCDEGLNTFREEGRVFS